MYLSKLLLDPADRRVRREWGNVYELHRSVMSGFADGLERVPGRGRVLFRAEEDRSGRPMLLVQSPVRPDWTGLGSCLLPGDPFDPAPNPAVKEIAPVFVAGQWLRFRLRANVTVKKQREGRPQGRRVAVVGEDAQLAWLGRKAAAAGFRVVDRDVGVSQTSRDLGYKAAATGSSHRLEFHVVQFDGVLQVMEPDQLAAVLAEGIGSAKGFGCGLLSVAPA